MRINTNLASINAYNNLQRTDNALNKSLERLSSGLRINRAADDAAGLAISEKMRAQVRGLNQAVRNSQDAISLIQTAEGALNESHSILQRMRELAVQAANDTLTASDRQEIQKEIDQLTTELDRIGNTTEFNTKKLLDGTTSALTSTDKLTTEVFMRGGLRVEDQFGQKARGGGNYKLEIVADPGEAQIQKTDIMKIKHDTNYIYNTEDSGLTDFSAENLRYGEYTVTTSAGNSVPAEDINTIHNLFTSNTAALSLTVATGNESLSGSFGVKITNVDYAAEQIDFQVRYSFMTVSGAVTEGSYFVTGHDISAGSTFNVLQGLTGGETLNIEFSSATIGDYTAGDVATFAVDMGNASTAAVTVDSVSISSGEYESNILGQDYKASATAVMTISQEATFWNHGPSTFNMIQVGPDGELSSAEIRTTFETLGDTDSTNPAVTFDYQGEIGQRGTLDSTLDQLDRFWDASGNLLVEDPQTITLVQGDGTRTSFTIFRDDTIHDVVNKMNDAVAYGLGQAANVNVEGAQFVQYVSEPTSGGTFDTVQGTFLINSAIPGQRGDISFVGDEGVINALSLTTVRDSKESQFTVSVINAHSDAVVAADMRITGNTLIGVVHENVDVRFDPLADIEVGWQKQQYTGSDPWEKGEYDHAPNSFYFKSKFENDLADKYETFIHLADNTMVFQIGANPMQDVGAGIGDMRAAALGVDNVLVTNRDSANRAIGLIDRAIGRVSDERGKLGAIQNKLEHTIANLQVAAENLTAAESRIRDLDMAQEMMAFTRNQIMMQAGTAMLAQANMKPQVVLQLIG